MEMTEITETKLNELQRLDKVLAGLGSDNAPGLIVSVRHRGKTLVRRGLGLASLDSGLVNTPATKMRIGSTTKHFACALALLLRDQGLLSIDEPVARWLPELPASQGRRTLREFMSHTGGTRDYLDLSLISNGLAILPEDGAYGYQCRQQDENFASGTRFMYNNGGYRMLSLIIERVLDMPLAQALSQHLFSPLSMHDTSMWSNDLDPLPGSAMSHMVHPSGRFTKSLFPAVILGEGGIASTLDDMQRWLTHLRAPTLWPQALSDELMAPTILANGYVQTYGFGLIQEQWRGVRLMHHAGGVVGGSCQMLAAPDHDLQIIVMSNRSDIGAPDIAQNLLAALLEPELAAPDVAAPGNLAASLAGDYVCQANGRHFRIEGRDERLFLQMFGMPLPLTEGADGSLRVNLLAVIALDVRPITNAQGKVVALDVVEQGEHLRCERLVEKADASDVLSKFFGHWYSHELGADVTIEPGEPAVLHVAGLYGRNRYRIEPLLDDMCQFVCLDPGLPLNGTLRIAPAVDGARAIMLDTSRTRNLRLLEVLRHD